MSDFFIKVNLKDGVATVVKSEPFEGHCVQQ